MKLTDLEPGLYRYVKVTRDVEIVDGDPATWKPGDPTHTERRTMYDKHPVDSLAEAQALVFHCPKCGWPGGHLIECTIAGRGVEDAAGSHNKAGKPVRWSLSGSDFSNLSLSPSVLIEDGCAWHGFVTSGNVTGV